MASLATSDERETVDQLFVEIMRLRTELQSTRGQLRTEQTRHAILIDAVSELVDAVRAEHNCRAWPLSLIRLAILLDRH